MSKNAKKKKQEKLTCKLTNTIYSTFSNPTKIYPLQTLTIRKVSAFQSQL